MTGYDLTQFLQGTLYDLQNLEDADMLTLFFKLLLVFFVAFIIYSYANALIFKPLLSYKRRLKSHYQLKKFQRQQEREAPIRRREHQEWLARQEQERLQKEAAAEAEQQREAETAEKRRRQALDAVRNLDEID